MRPTQLLAAAALTAAAAASATLAGPPQYMIIDIGVVQSGQTASQGLRISAGGVGVGRALGSPSQAFSWTLGGGIVGLPNLASRPFAAANGANDMGAVVGTGTTTAFGSSPLPIIWQNGVATELALPAGHTFGRANDINNSGVAVGSVGSGSGETAVIYSGGSATLITQTTSNGSRMTTAFGINDAGLVVGNGIDPNNAARNVGIVYDTITGVATDIGSLVGRNGALAFDISEAGHVVGSSMLNQGAGTPFIWTADGGMVEVGLPAGASQGSARGVNSNGWVVGTGSSAFALPFLFDGNQTYLLQDLLVNPTGWDISMNTSSSALGISENGTIIGTGIFNGQTHAYAAVLVPAPGVLAALAPAGILAFRRRR